MPSPYQLPDRWFEDCKEADARRVYLEEATRIGTEAERARIREWVEKRKTMMPVLFEDFPGYEKCLNDLIDFLER